jgi:hypothetical protein
MDAYEMISPAIPQGVPIVSMSPATVAGSEPAQKIESRSPFRTGALGPNPAWKVQPEPGSNVASQAPDLCENTSKPSPVENATLVLLGPEDRLSQK